MPRDAAAAQVRYREFVDTEGEGPRTSNEMRIGMAAIEAPKDTFHGIWMQAGRDKAVADIGSCEPLV
eukprot:CAMPEP_0183361626 /NCGR_PEP_ID=MMETSP0164_2-20130417/62753_1 /TAXON_ID=221442 /ORGANISM="Coccolithus pelagicus ssp braarudi, Strain PLY182g" /LENGTH=66 /DNA_ID=CAMNT_0025536269 /DNA_START=56 /DNA_END=253 /DNA_ORIENTATION=+